MPYLTKVTPCAGMRVKLNPKKWTLPFRGHSGLGTVTGQLVGGDHVVKLDGGYIYHIGTKEWADILVLSIPDSNKEA